MLHTNKNKNTSKCRRNATTKPEKKQGQARRRHKAEAAQKPLRHVLKFIKIKHKRAAVRRPSDLRRVAKDLNLELLRHLPGEVRV